MKRKKQVKCAFLEYMWHVMVHCKHSRLAKSAERPISFKMTARPFPGKPLDVFFPCCLLVGHHFKGLHGVEGEVRQLDGHATRERVYLALCFSPFTS